MMKKLSVIVLALVMVMAMVVTAHAAPPAVEGQWKVDTVVYTETGTANMNQNMPMPDFTWEAGVHYPDATGGVYTFKDGAFIYTSLITDPSAMPYSWHDDAWLIAHSAVGDVYWSVSVSGDKMVLNCPVLESTYYCTLVPGSAPSGGGEGGGEDAGDSGSSNPDVPNTADPFSLGLFTTMAAASLGGIVALKKKSRG